MFRRIAIVALAAAVGLPRASQAAVVDVSVTSQGLPQVDAAPGALVPFEVTLALSDTANEGLCLFHFDLRYDGGDVPPVADPTSGPLLSFIAPDGVTNPEGYGGAQVGGVLRQIGGSQNTLKLAGPPPLPSGTVVTGVGHSPIVVASGLVTAPIRPGSYVLRAEDVLGRVIKDGENGSGPIWQTEWAFKGAIQNLTVVVRPCEQACADADANGVRDDNCVWVDCQPDGQTCSTTAIVFGDMGGAFGECAPDGFVNLFDRSQALTCFAGTNPCLSLNIDAGGPFGNCNPDGFCNIFDVSHALTAFAGSNPCSCPPGSPMAEWLPPAPVGTAALRLVIPRLSARPGELIEVEVFGDFTPRDAKGPGLMGYQLDLGISGGLRGHLDLIDVRVDTDRRDFVFRDRADVFQAKNVGRHQVLAGLDGGDFPIADEAYLATFVYRSTPDAAGVFVVDTLNETGNGGQTFFIADRSREISLHAVSPATVDIRSGISKSSRSSSEGVEND